MQKYDKKERHGKALEQRGLSGNHYSKRGPRFNSKTFILSYVLSIVILISMGWYAWNSFKQLDKFENQKDEIAELRGVILYFDEVLTMSAHMAAATGDLTWESRYLKYEAQLDEAIQRLKIISRENIKYKFVEKTDIANIELVALENKVFNLIHQGSPQAATNLLNSQRYKDLKLSYQEGMTSLAATLKSSAKKTHDKLRSEIIVAILLTATVVLLLSFGWIVLIRINKNIIRQEELELFLSEPGKNKFCNRTAIICSIGAVFIAVLGLLGWIPSLSFLGNISPHFIPMAPTTSICFILLGLIVLIQIRYRLRGASRFSAIAVILLLSVFGIIELAEYFTGIDIEDFLIPDAGMLGLMRKARMSPATGATFFFSGIAALLLILRETKNKQVKRICSGSGIVGNLVVITGITILISYLYKNPLLYGSQTIPMAATTAIGFIFLGVGLVTAAGLGCMPIRLLTGHSSRAKLLRVFLPLSVLIVLSQDILHRFVLVPYHINSALFSVLSLIFFMTITSIVVTIMGGVIGRALDAAEKKRKQAVKTQETLFDNLPCIAMILKKGTREIVVSNKVAQSIGAVPGKTCFQTCADRDTPCPFCLAPKVWETNESRSSEPECRDKCYRGIWVPLTEDLYVHYIFDITERKQAEKKRIELEDQLRQTQKMEAIGTLAGGIAHDFNNVLMALMGYIELSLDDLPQGTVLYDNMEQSMACCHRAKDMVQQILAFGRKTEVEIKPMEVAPVVKEVLKLLRPSIPATIEIAEIIETGSSIIMADSTQIHQIVINLCTNAVHAIGDNHGLVKVSLADIDMEFPTLTGFGTLLPGSYIKLTVEDSGCGINKELMERIFEPFFTTKDIGKGTGMGLSVVHGIVKSYGGQITVDSKPGKGTIFDVFLPTIESHNTEQLEPSSEIASGGTESILLVDDERSVTDTLTQMLQRLGYTVHGFTNPYDALETFRADLNQFDLVITDYVMPNMTGTELARQLMNIRPDIPIILCTGFSEDINTEKAMMRGIKEFLMKPISKNEIAAAIRNILDKKEITV